MTEALETGHTGQRMIAALPSPLASRAEVPARAEALDFTSVYREHAAGAFRAAAAMGVPRAACDDVVQEAFLIVHRGLHTFEGRSSLKTWIAGIVLNVVRHYRRSVARRHPHEMDRHAPSVPDDLRAETRDPLEAAEHAEGAALLHTLLGTLSEERREVLVLAELEELSVPEIADALEIKLNTAYSRLRLAREDFERALSRHRASEKWRAR
ncbi:MAG: RNA polymerase sigma factor [Myxococcales bacterium]|nr:RNA polymerase sigma factor [Myxococcales bacterium]